MCMEPGVANGQTKGDSTASLPGGSTTAVPVFLIQSASEYGYAVETVSGPATFTIPTQNVTLLPTTTVTIKVSFVNGTAAVGAEVSASIVGQDYYWWSNPNLDMSNQTNSLGIVQLIIPQAPAVISAWDWIPVNLPISNNTVLANIGGQTINVTIPWQPTYVGLSASGMIIPPQDSLNLTLRYQQPQGWATPLGVATEPANSSGAPVGTIASQPTGVPSTVQSVPSSTGSQSQYYLPNSIPSIEGAIVTTGTTISTHSTTGSGVTDVAIGAAAVVLAAIGIAFVVLRARPHRQ